MAHILIIEDEAWIRENLQEILELEGFKTIGAPDGSSGIELARQHMPDLIICDVMMPCQDGYQVLKTLQSSTQTSSIPFIFLTAKIDWDSMRHGMNLGADDYLTKPFTPQEVIEAIKTRLKKRSAQTNQCIDNISHPSDRTDGQRCNTPTTTLPNRDALEIAFSHLITTITPDQPLLALLHLTFNQLATIKATLGPNLGQSLMPLAGQRINTLPALAGLASLNDHQLGVVIGPVASLEEVEAKVQAVLSLFDSPFLLPPHQVFAIPHIGIALYPQDGEMVDMLMLKAEMAEINLQNQSSKLINFYSPALHKQARQRFELEADLHHALDRQEFQVYYQPQFDLQTERLMGAEALVRWFHPQRGCISPTEFISIAESTGLIIPIGEWILQTACTQVKNWQRDHPDFRLSVNLSAQQFCKNRLLPSIRQILSELSFPPHQLELEITESILMQDTALAQQLINALKQDGLRIAIDDFGVGYSSFSYLQQFSLDTLKIDRCFMQHLAVNTKKQKIVSAIIQMAHELGLEVVAEGIDQEADLRCLRRLNCDTAQGYWFSQPVSSHEFSHRFIASLATVEI
jgi:diguanylate cyclase